MRIIGPPSANAAAVSLQLRIWAKDNKVNTLFMESIVPAEWKWGLSFSIDPVGLIAQSLKETDGGKFTGKVKAEWYNPCGLKIRHLGIAAGTDDDEPLAHQLFPNWEVGCLAHVQHICAYAGHIPWEGAYPIVDPRYTYVADDVPKLENWHELGGRWAPASNYGDKIEILMKEIQTSGIK